MYKVYRIINDLNGKSYIGFATNLKRRFAEHKSLARRGSPFYLHRAMRKDGIENFHCEELCYGEDHNAGLRIAEPLMIEIFKPEYNMTKGGDGLLGLSHTAEQKAIWREERKGRVPWNKGLKTGPLPIEVCKKMGDLRRGKTFSLEARIAMSEGRKGIQFSNNHRKNISKSAQGRIPWNKGKIGVQIPWNKGLKRSQHS